MNPTTTAGREPPVRAREDRGERGDASVVTGRPTAAELLLRDGALLGVDDLRRLGLDERAIHHVLRGLPEISLPGVRRVFYAAKDVREALRR
jgi:hypothetical protein